MATVVEIGRDTALVLVCIGSPSEVVTAVEFAPSEIEHGGMEEVGIWAPSEVVQLV